MSDASDDLEIRSGGIVAVDTAALRDAARRLVAAACDADAIATRLVGAIRALTDAGVWVLPPSRGTAAAGDHARRLAVDLETMADVYEVVELNIAAEAARAAGDEIGAGVIDARRAEILRRTPGAAATAALTEIQWRASVPLALGGQWGLGIGEGPVLLRSAVGDLLALLGVGIAGGVGRGLVARGTVTPRHSDEVQITRIDRSVAPAADALAAVAARIPDGTERVRVETYSMPDGSRQFVVYVAGTDFHGPHDEAWDMRSNTDLYFGEGSASYNAVLAALEQSGARPGDTVTLAGHSQGAMVASLLAVSGRYDVPLLITLGDPVQADVGPDTLAVDLRHVDDPVAALALGGFASTVGAAGSMVVTRDTAGTMATGRSMFDPHGKAEYQRTAELLDSSPDPRMDAVRERFDELGRAREVRVDVYGARRDDPLFVVPDFTEPIGAEAPGIRTTKQISASSGGGG